MAASEAQVYGRCPQELLMKYIKIIIDQSIKLQNHLFICFELLLQFAG